MPTRTESQWKVNEWMLESVNNPNEWVTDWIHVNEWMLKKEHKCQWITECQQMNQWMNISE